MIFSFLLNAIRSLQLGFTGGGGGSTTSTSTNQLYSPEEAARRAKVMDAALALYGTGGTTKPYPGAAPTPEDTYTRAAKSYLLGNAAGFAPWFGGVQDAFSRGLNATDVTANPALAGAVQAAINPITQQFSGPGGVLSLLRQGANEAGQFGGSRQGIAEGAAAQGYLRQVGDTSAKLYSDAYGRGLDAMVKTLTTAPMMANLATTPADWLGAIGTSNEAYGANQEAYNAAAREWEMNYPWLNLQNLANIVFGAGNQGGTSTTYGSGNQTNPFLSALGAAGLGFGLYNTVIPWITGGAAAGTAALGSGLTLPTAESIWPILVP